MNREEVATHVEDRKSSQKKVNKISGIAMHCHPHAPTHNTHNSCVDRIEKFFKKPLIHESKDEKKGTLSQNPK